ncbi:MAG: type II secretion system F family protein [Chloroflexi bacterium]|nr:type II secretion system F family protein [Chloroflexota bacterium]
MDLQLLVSAFFALGIALMFQGLDLMISGRRAALRSRIDRYATSPKELPAETTLGKPGAGSRDWARQLRTELARADVLITPSEYVLAMLLFGLVGLLAGYFVLGNVPLALLGTILGLAAPRFYIKYLQYKRLVAFQSGLENALPLLANMLRSGYGLSQALDALSKELAPPLATEFGRVVRELSLGLSLQDALANLVRRNPVLDLDMVVTAINVNHDVGGSLAAVLDGIADTIRDRVRIAGEIRAITAQQRLSATVLMLLPFGVSLAIYVMNPDYIALLWQSTCGLSMAVVAGILLVIGYFTIRRILALKY